MTILPAVSVIVPVYNAEPYVARCVRSLFSQTLNDLEFIFIDDCSQDKSVDIICQVLEKEYAWRKEQVRFFKMPQNSGQAIVRMQGISMATGDYVIHCDSDDELYNPDAYRLLYEKAISDDLDIVTCNYLKEKENLQLVLIREECKDVRDLLLDKVQGSLVCRLIRRSLLDGICAPVGDMGEDLVISVQATLRSISFGHIDEPFYVYKYRSSSISKVNGQDAAIRRHQGLVKNVGLLLDILTNSYGFNENDPVLLTFKYYARHCIEPYVGNIMFYRLWNNTFPEIDSRLLLNPCISFERKVWFLLIHMHLYVYVKGITRWIRNISQR